MAGKPHVGGAPKAQQPAPAPQMSGSPAVGSPASHAKPSPETWSDPTSVAPEPAAPGGKLASFTTTTQQNVAYCRKWPDTISSDTSRLRALPPLTSLDVTCWTTPSMPGEQGQVKGSSTWLKTDFDCYINEADLQTQMVYPTILNQCKETKTHWVGILQEQYKREDCYQCPNQDCPSQNLGSGPFADVECFVEGSAVSGNRLVNPYWCI